MKKAVIIVSLFAMVSLMFVGGANAMMPPPGPTTSPCEIGVFSGGSWYLDMGGTGMWNSMMDTMMSFGTGLEGAMPVAGDWNGTGTTSIGVYDPATGTWYVDMNGNDAWDGTPTDALYTFGGMPGAIPVTGDWNGTGKTKIGIYDPSTGAWYLDMNGNGKWDGTPTDTMYTFGTGLTGAMPVTGDWNGTGKTEIGVFDPSTGNWYLDMNGDGMWDGTTTDMMYTFGAGLTGAMPVTGDWNGTGKTEIGMFDPSTGNWYLDMNGDGMWDGTTTDMMYTFGTGLTGATPISGKW